MASERRWVDVTIPGGVWKYADTYEYLERVREGLGPLIITCAISGGVQGKEANPNLPESPEELAQQAYEAYQAGASVVHVHFRDPENLARNSMALEVSTEANRLIREACPDIVINNTTGGGPGTTMEDRFEAIKARPEMASLNLGPDMSRFTVAPRRAPLPHPHDGYTLDDCVPFTYGIIEDLARAMQENDIKPELETYQPGHYWVSRNLINQGLLQKPYVFQFVMGYQTSIFPTPHNLVSLVQELPEDSLFFACGIGPHQLPITTMAILMGGHARVGLEDNVYYTRGRKLTGNGESVARLARIAHELDRPVATPAQAREILGLPATPRPFSALASINA
jgi:3-keto-5-aminohexanoate cleavage enzyme